MAKLVARQREAVKYKRSESGNEHTHSTTYLESEPAPSYRSKSSRSRISTGLPSRPVADRPSYPRPKSKILPKVLPNGKSQDRFIKLTFKASNQELAQIYSVTPSTIKDWKSQFKFHGIPTGENGFPESPNADVTDYMRINDETAIVIGDAEIPDHDVEIFGMIIDIAQKFDVKTLIINGDFVALDSFSRHPKSTVYSMSFEQELHPAIESLRVFLKHFTRVAYVTGNHERRLPSMVDGHLTVGMFLKDLANVEFSEHSYCVLNSAGSEFLICHPNNYTKKALSVPREIASIKLMHVISGHTHHLAIGYDKSGQFWVVEGGHCRDANKTRYKTTKISTHPEWNPGFVLVLHGVPYLIDRNTYDFWSQVTLPRKFGQQIQKRAIR